MIHLLSLLHTISVYANRWGGPRYRTEELAKFLNKHLYNIQEHQLRMGEKVNTCLSHDAFLSSTHTPLYLSSIRASDELDAWKIKDELGFEAIFAEGTEILTYVDHPEYGPLEWLPVESCIPGTRRVINLELVPELKNDKINHHLPFTENFLSIKCSTADEAQSLLCDGLSAMMILKNENNTIRRMEQFDSGNIQEVYLSEIVELKRVGRAQFYYPEFSPFSYMLQKNRALSNKSGHRYYKHRHDTKNRRWLEKMRSKVFHIKKDNVNFKMEMKHVED